MKHTWRTRLAAAVVVPALAAGGALVATVEPAMATSYVSCRELQTVRSRAVPATGGLVYYGVYSAASYVNVKIIDQTVGQTVYEFELWGPAERYSSVSGLNPNHGYLMQLYCNFHADGAIG